MKTAMRNWQTVFSFTWKQRVGTARYKAVTALIGVLIVGLIFCAMYFSNKENSDDSEKLSSEVSRILVLNSSGYELTTLEEQCKATESLSGVSLEAFTGSAEELSKKAGEKEKTVGCVISKSSSGYMVTMVLPYDNDFDEDTVTSIGEELVTPLKLSLLEEGGVTAEQLAIVNMQVTGRTLEVGEQDSIVYYLIKLVAPMVFGLFMYMILLLYGQDVCKEISVEKTSKLMETMLTSVHPYAMITGKVLAIYAAVMMQCFIWIGCLLVGVFGGSYLILQMNPDSTNTVATMVDYVRENIGATAFSVPSMIMAIIVFAVGCLLFFTLAGVAGSIVSKPEDTASAQAIFVYPVLISWIVPYFASLQGNEGVMRVCRIVPFTAPFCVPVDLLAGNAGWLTGLLAMVLVLITALVLVWLTARIYRGLVLYTGQKISPKTIWGVISGKEKLKKTKVQ